MDTNRKNWAPMFGIYLFGVCGAAAVSKIVPLASDLNAAFDLGAGQFGWLVSAFAVPAVMLALMSALVVERFGSRTVMIVAAGAGVLSDVGFYFTDNVALLWAMRLLEGTAVVHIYTAAPALLMRTMDRDRRSTAMTLWSTYMPVGTALGLALGGWFSETDSWRMVFAVHGAMMGMALLIGLRLPSVEGRTHPRASVGKQVAALRRALTQADLLAHGLCYLIVIGLGIGVNFAMPQYLARVSGYSMAEASGIVAGATLAMLAGSGMAGVAFARKIAIRPVFIAAAFVGFGAGTLAFQPGLSLLPTYIFLASWFAASGAAVSSLLAALPGVAGETRLSAGAALVNKAGALATLISPPIWLSIVSHSGMTTYGAILAVCWLTAIALITILDRGMRTARA